MSVSIWPAAGTTCLAEDLVTVITAAGASIPALTSYYANLIAIGKLRTSDPTLSGLPATSFPPTNAVNILAFGAVPSGPDCHAAITAAIAYAKVAKCGIYFPPGTYTCASGLDLSGAQSINFLGETFLGTSGIGGSTILFTQSSGLCIDCRSAYGITFTNVNLVAQAAIGTFNGTVLSLDSTFASPGGYHKVEGCTISSIGAAGTLVSCNMTFNCSFKDVIWGKGLVAVYGTKTDGSDFANGFTFINCSNGLGNIVQDVYLNPGLGWSWIGCSFEPITSGAARGIRSDGSHIGLSLSVQSCWFGDCAGGTWIQGALEGVSISGNLFSGNSTTDAITFAAGSVGVSIRGNVFQSLRYAYAFGSGNASNVYCEGNIYASLHGDGSGGYDKHIYSGAPISGRVEDATSFAVFPGNQPATFTRLRSRWTLGAQSIADSTDVTLTNWTTDYDPNGNSSAGVWTCPFTGYYQVNACVELVVPTGYVEAFVYVNGAPVGRGARGAIGAGAGSAGSNISDMIYAQIGQQVKVHVFQNSGAPATVYLGTFSIHYLSS